MNALAYLDLPHIRQARGLAALPGSKSISNRVLLIAALAEGRTEISGLLDSDDTRVMLAALRQLGVAVTDLGQGRVAVEGARRFPAEKAELFLGNAGTAFRPLTAALALMGGDYRLSGVPRMHERPIGDLVDALRAWGARIDYLGQAGYPPLHIGRGDIRADRVRVQGSVSSQFLTALLLAAPIEAGASGRPVTIEVIGELISKPYIEITLNLMARYGVNVVRDGWRAFTIEGDARYRSPGSIAVEGDASTASYLLALGVLGGGPVRVTGVGEQSIQGDTAFADTLAAMGANITKGSDWIEASGQAVAEGGRIKAFDADFNLIPDAAMTAATMALFADGPCRLRNIGSWRVKETDRIHAMHTELAKLGAKVESGPDWLSLTPPADSDWRDAHIGTWDDHRMAMCFSLAAFGPAAVRILDPGCVSKTFPDYFDVYAGLVSA
ncbi:3-phosphoshikimate 1-carboxyvinyltransferase [Bordetella avium]|uniref:3-phosphoshikimate 1-carboxyvinyltransferase n=1 Tax=Bordetella avium (strain 197N) TaxID=360910 RepID=AROA_BORA1|nr:3-phosphoshikimate 1-carboxyvinyltransferase [Bordetella avium]Q2L2S7.1 RecName: Full=3-phosphoshikimate 1-carboxyvinyltransferase; AltName: Full=5-enolpyruvylshikimate-3-phosphate synthase; Short=EPSP synthase; Short=EPSPS [Bordetella avium 197N]AZY48765.1 3-phosphoshikimate 1-carboxyvinyltransferase [Bordetella avium]AZY52143.1 3-phosphoshikimate 1-carboxyvinyltransferase [Bordetella avium]RIQ17943.1 3-phosphoshikimate 1-carboxyvinyltransferase [Bordetella avium]RIQ36419.1 3-phosphoshikim